MLIFDSVARVVLELDTSSFPYISTKFRDENFAFLFYHFAIYHDIVSSLYHILFGKYE